jgi:glycosyltransferase involved in cell wall biosynthesis
MTQAGPQVVVYSAPFPPKIGGMEQFSRSLALGLHDLGCAVEVVTDTPLAEGQSELQVPFVIHRTTVMADKLRHFARADAVIFIGVRLRETLRSIPLRKRIILSHHGTYMDKNQPRTLVLGLVKRLLGRLFTNVSVSQFIAEKLGGRHRVIHACFDDSVFSAAPRGERPPGSFLFYGRLVGDKGCHLAIKALAEVRRSNEAARLTIVGGGPEKEALVQLANETGVASAVTFAGVVSNQELGRLVASSQCVLVPSIWEEPFGAVSLEALAGGCEVILSNRGGMHEGLGGHGWLIDPNVAELSAAMLRVLQGEKRRGTGVAEWLQAHTRDAIARDYLDEIRKRLP